MTLAELRIQNLGVVEDVTLVMQPGMTAVTGETGAGKTMLVEAIRLLSGARAEPHMIRTGATEAFIEGRFVSGESETILARAIPGDGRSRAYIDGRMSTIAALGEAAEQLIDLHAQNSHQSLLVPVAQRDALDQFANVDTTRLLTARREVAAIEERLRLLGGDAQTRAREIDLLRYQLDEIAAADLGDPNETELLAKQEETLADVTAHRVAAATVHEALSGEGAVIDGVSTALSAATSRTPLDEVAARLRAISAELDDLSLDVTRIVDQLVDDPELLAQVQARRHKLRQLEKKYGPNLSDVIAFRNEISARLQDLEQHDEVLAETEAALVAANDELQIAENEVFTARRKAAPKLQKAVEERLRHLALPNARFEVAVEQNEKHRAGEVTFGLSANPGMPVLPIAKAASGGELSRTMLALHLGLLNKQTHTQSRTLIFDEVDAGVGGEAAISIGRALAELAHANNQVIVVTHLPQVAACADNQLLVSKTAAKDSTSTNVVQLAGVEREIELARMLAGRPDSKSGRAHARELMSKK